ncbi:crotonase/enoyl-CoA hydratase family protein [Herbaspirillum sp. HC18]|nr:crotonase/enoyl-CoA hydratase family protein [Herbaspirillum sp. HC18]
MSTVRTEKNGRITTVILDRPEARNAVDGPTAKALADAFRAFDADDGSDVAVLYGEGGNFCAGADLKAMVDPQRRNRLQPAGDGPMGPSRMRLSKPVIAAVSGFAVAGGLELALWCDLRVAEEDATFGVFCRRWGVPLIDGGTVRLPHLIGQGRALDLILTGRPVGTAEALAIGLVNRVVPNGQARRAAEALAAEIARFPQACLRTDRENVYDCGGMPLEEALQMEFARSLPVIEAESLSGAQRFASGAGRHGDFSGGKPE